MTFLLSALICVGYIVCIHELGRAVDWLCCQPWWDRARPALMVAEVALGAVGLAVGLLGGSLTAEAVGVSLAVVGFWAFVFTAVEPVV